VELQEAPVVQTETVPSLEAAPPLLSETTAGQDMAAAPVMQQPRFDLEGRLDVSYRYRTQSRRNTTDSDSFASLYLDGTSTDEEGNTEYRFHIDGYASMDWNGLEASDQAFYGLADTRNSRFRPFLYAAWMESETWLKGAKVRIGRQEIHREDALYFDGARVDFGDGNWQALVYAGAPVRFYESSRSGDFLSGVGLRYWMRRNIRFGLDQVYLRDDAPPADPSLTVNNALTILSAHWLQSRYATIDGSSSWVSGRPRRSQLRALIQQPDQRIWMRLEAHRQNDYGEVVATDLSPFAATLSDVRPYWSASAELGKGLSNKTDLALGFQGRWLDSGLDEGLYNRQYDRWYGSLSKREFLSKDWRAGLRADFWDSSGPSILTGGAFATYEATPGHVFEFGTDFSKYRYDAFTGREYLDDRQVYARISYPLRKDTTMRLRLARDGSQFGTDYLVEISVGWEF